MAGKPSQNDKASAMIAPLAWALAYNAVPKGDKSCGNLAFEQVYANQSCWDHIWGVPPDMLGTVGYDCGNDNASDMAREIAQFIDLKRRLTAIRASAQTGVVSATVLIQIGNDPLDVIVSAHEAITNPSWSNTAATILAALLVFSAAIVRKSVDAADGGQAEDMATREA